MTKQELIKQARDENRLIQQQFPLASIKTTEEMLKTAGFDVLDVDMNTLKKQGVAVVSFSSDVSIDETSFNTGQKLKDIAMRSFGLAAVKKEKRKIEKDNSEPFKLKFPRKTGAKIYAELKELLNIIAKTVSIDGKEMQLDFDISDCLTKSDLAKRISQILGAAQAIKDGMQTANEYKYIKEMSEALARAEMQQTAVRFKRVSGQYLIENGIADKMIVGKDFSQSEFQKAVANFGKKTGFFSRLWSYLKGDADTVYRYGNIIVDASREYIIECNEPCNKSANHNEEMILRYEFGEQVYRGFGIQLVVQYVKTIETNFNLAIDEAHAAESQPNSDTDNN